MERTVITVTCDRCKEREVPGNRRGAGWAHLWIVPAGVKPGHSKRIDVCPDCLTPEEMAELDRWQSGPDF